MEGAGERRRAGIRRGLPFGIAVFAISISFGVLARPVMGPVAPIIMSILVFSGAAQFGALAVLIAGGGAGAAIAAGVLLNARYLAMGIALAPSLRGRPDGLGAAVWGVIAARALAAAALKLAGPLALGGTSLRPGALSVVELLASALLAALVVVETFGSGRSLVLDARVLGAAFAAVAVWKRAPMIVVVLGAAAVTALARLLS